MPVVHGLLDESRYLTGTMFGKLKGDRDAFAKTSAVPVSTSTPPKKPSIVIDAHTETTSNILLRKLLNICFCEV